MTSIKTGGVVLAMMCMCTWFAVGAVDYSVYTIIDSGSCESRGMQGIYDHAACNDNFGSVAGQSETWTTESGYSATVSSIASGLFQSSGNCPNSVYPPGCYLDFTANQNYFFTCINGFDNIDPNADMTSSGYYPICLGSPTPAPAPASMSGDPILKVNGYKVKFDLPIGARTLLWKDHKVYFFARADVFTPDKKHQWFSEFEIVLGDAKVAQIQRRKLALTTKEVPGAVNTMSITTFDGAGNPTLITRAGSHSLGEGAISLRVNHDGQAVGHMKREVVAIESNLFHFSVSPQIATKFGANAGKALKYTHLDLTMQKMSVGAEDGLLAEFFGLIPMSKETARLIRSMQQ